jgi:hypothetical protein
MKNAAGATATSMRRDWRHVAEAKAGRRMRVVQFFIAAGSLLFATYMVKTLLSPPMWWAQEGLASDPGNFLGALPLDYPVCAPWTGRNADLARREWKMTEVTTPRPLAVNDPLNLAVMLPKNAQVMKVYCAAGREECSWAKCDPPLTFLAWDGMYARGRVLIVMLANHGRMSQRVDVRLWVLWE